MTEPIGGQGIGMGGQGDVLLGDPGTVAGAASSTLPSVVDAQQLAQILAQRLASARNPVPSALMTSSEIPSPILPQAPMKATPQGAIPQGPFGSVGERKRADTQAVFNTAGNLLNKVQDRLHEQKVAKFKRDYETMASAIRGYNEGEATGNKEQMKHNADILNRLLADDPKTAKELSKGMNVNLNPMAEGKHKGKEKPNPANDAFKAVWMEDQKKFAEARAKGEPALAPQVKAMMRATPQTLQSDPRYAAYLEGLQRGAYPKAGEQLTFTKDLLEIQQRIQNNQFTNETRGKIAEMFTGTRDRATQGALLRTAMTIQDSKNRMATLERMWADRSNKLYQGVHERTEAMKDKIKASGGGDDKKLSTLVGGLDKAASSLNKQLEDARKAHDVNKMGQISQQLESLGIMQQIANAEIARRLNLNSEDFNQEQFKLDEEMMKNYEALFPDAQAQPGQDAADQ
jgi:hypothetical protein